MQVQRIKDGVLLKREEEKISHLGNVYVVSMRGLPEDMVWVQLARQHRLNPGDVVLFYDENENLKQAHLAHGVRPACKDVGQGMEHRLVSAVDAHQPAWAEMGLNDFTVEFDGEAISHVELMPYDLEVTGFSGGDVIIDSADGALRSIGGDLLK